jgi:hypothetical protein
MSTGLLRNVVAAHLAATMGSLAIAGATPSSAAAAERARPAAARCLNERHVYVRGEKPVLRWAVEGADAVQWDVGGWLSQRTAARGGEARCPLDTSLLRVGEYEVRAQPLQNGHPAGAMAIFPLTISAERNPQRFPVWNWPSVYERNMGWWVERGFNGLHLSTSRDPFDPESERTRQLPRVLDEAARLGVDLGLYLWPLSASRWENEEAARCLLPDGRRDASRVYPREPAVLEYARRVASGWVDRFAEFPALRHALLSSEYQTPFCLNDVARALAKQEAGIDLSAVLRPEWLTGGVGSFDAAKLPPALQPRDGLIPDDHAVYRFLKWWWERGHGTSVVNAEMARILKAKRPDLLAWHDPYRLAPVYGSHA